MAYKTEQVIAALKESKGMVYVAAKKLGCHPQTIYNYIKKFSSVKEAIETERGFMCDTAELALARAIAAGEAWAVCFYLKTQGKHRGYVERIEHEHRDADAQIKRELARLGLGGEAQAARRTQAATDADYVN